MSTQGLRMLERARTEVSPTVSTTTGTPTAEAGGPSASVPAGVAESPRVPLDRVALSAKDAPPPNVALLHVFRHSLPGDRLAFSILGTSAYEPLESRRGRGRPGLVLAHLAQAVDPTKTRMPSKIIDALLDWSMENSDVGKWVNGLRRERSDDLCLIVIDHTGFEMPWELLELPAATRSELRVPLGTAVRLARWQDVQDNVTFESVPLELEQSEHAGEIVAYVDATELAGGAPERVALGRLGAHLQGKLGDLTRWLAASRESLGLVYVAAHGDYAASVLDFAIGSPDGERLVLGRLRRESLPALADSGAIVFLNVCHSGRMFHEHEFLDADRLRGFPEVLLGHGAKGVIATTGFVDDEFAGELAQWLLTRLTDEDAPTICEALREWREQVWRASLDEPDDERKKLKLLNACMYVYYGSPLARLRLGSRDG